jgi:hypothetical protein
LLVLVLGLGWGAVVSRVLRAFASSGSALVAVREAAGLDYPVVHAPILLFATNKIIILLYHQAEGCSKNIQLLLLGSV